MEGEKREREIDIFFALFFFLSVSSSSMLSNISSLSFHPLLLLLLPCRWFVVHPAYTRTRSTPSKS